VGGLSREVGQMGDDEGEATQGGVGGEGGWEAGAATAGGARALYLFNASGDTQYRIHGTSEPWTIGHNVSSGCIRLINADVMDLYRRAKIGAKVIVL